MEGDFDLAFRQTLFSDFLSLRFRAPKLLDEPTIVSATVPGADKALSAQFHAEHDTYLYRHTRLAILAKRLVAVIDIRSRRMEAFPTIKLALDEMRRSVRVTSSPGQR